MSGISVDREGPRIIVWGHDHGDELDAAQARELASTLLNAADEMEAMNTLLTERAVRRIAEHLDAAGDNWPAAAASIAHIIAVTPGDDTRRDQVTLAAGWAREVNDGQLIAECPPTMYRDEDGRWHALGWSSAARKLLYRPDAVAFDEDAGVITRADARPTE